MPKFGIEYGAALYNISIFNNQAHQYDSYTENNSLYVKYRTDLLRVLETDQSNIRAEQARRAEKEEEQ